MGLSTSPGDLYIKKKNIYLLNVLLACYEHIYRHRISRQGEIVLVKSLLPLPFMP